MLKTKHWDERQRRLEFIRKNIGYGQTLAEFIVDKGYRNGLEVHKVTSTGITVISNLKTRKLITVLISRPRQIERLYTANNMTAPEGLLKIAKHHEEKGWNEI